LVERAPKVGPRIRLPLPDRPPTYPKLTAAIAEAARYNGSNAQQHHGCGLCIAQKQAIDAIASELLPAIFEGEWVPARKRAWPASDEPARPIFDHPTAFCRRGARRPHGWHNCAMVTQPYNHVFRNGEFHPPFAVAAQTLSRQHQVGVWVAPELSAWFPGQTILVLLARNLVPELAPRFGFCAV
jgi:hypothetical protein